MLVALHLVLTLRLTGHSPTPCLCEKALAYTNKGPCFCEKGNRQKAKGKRKNLISVYSYLNKISKTFALS